MVRNLNEYEDGAEIRTDIAVVGAGAAGITIAHELAGSPHEVLLVESGGMDFDAETQALYEGSVVGVDNYYLDIARLRFFGGSTNHWDGHCRPLDEIDFERRDWVPYSGWPIKRADLDPYYARAQELCELGPFLYEAADWPELVPRLMDLAPSKLVNRLWQFGPPTRFGSAYGDALLAAPNVDVLTYANLADILLEESGNTVESVILRTLGGKTATLRPRVLVLACGGIENPRILLSCDRQHRNGLGNGYDNVGRYFMEHPHALVAFAVREGVELERFSPYYDVAVCGDTVIRAKPGVSEAEQERLGILNGCLDLGWGHDRSGGFLALREVGRAVAARQMPENLGSAVLDIIGDLDGVVGGIYRRMRDRKVLWFAPTFEQVPDPENRVTLSRERDALGMRRSHLDWRMLPLDKQSVRAACKLVGEELARLRMARMRIDDWVMDDSPDWRDVTGRYHHIGTTRMSANAREGVVDRNCRVHGIANLYVSGSSVFTTSGYANSTLTIVALAARLAEHLKQQKL